MVALLPLDYLLTAFQTHHPTSATSTHGSSVLKTISTSSTTKAETAVRLVSAFASSVIKRQRLVAAQRPIQSSLPIVPPDLR